jgi:uncharacterized membrane protein
VDQAIVHAAGTAQLVGLAVGLIMAIILGARLFGLGAKGFASLIGELGGFLVALYVIARPNDVLHLLLTFVGGIQAPTMPS